MVKPKPLYFMLVGVVFLVFGIFMLYVGISSPNWPTVNGVVGDYNIYHWAGNEGTQRYYLHVNYFYEVDDREYSNTDPSITQALYFLELGSKSYLGFSTEEKAENYIFNHYGGIGDTVTIYYHPGLPQLALTEPGLNRTYLSFFIVLSLIGLVWICL